MSSDILDYNRGAVRPMQCFREGWQLIKEEYWLFFGICFVGMFIGGAVPFGILLGPMWCGIEICLLRRMHGQHATFNHLFKGFDYFGPSVVATLCFMVPIVAVAVVLYIVFVVGVFALIIPQAQQGGGPPGAEFFGMLYGMIGLYIVVMMVVSAVVGAPFIFMYGLIVDRKMSGMQAVAASIKAVLGNFWGVFGLIFLNTLLSLAGSLICVGAYLLLPVTFAAYAVAYRQVFPLHPALTQEWPDDEEADAEPPATGITEL